MIAKALILEISDHTKDLCTYKDSCLWHFVFLKNRNALVDGMKKNILSTWK